MNQLDMAEHFPELEKAEEALERALAAADAAYAACCSAGPALEPGDDRYVLGLVKRGIDSIEEARRDFVASQLARLRRYA